MNYNRVVCFDLEMCCWNENGVGTTGEIIEIGLAEIDLAAGEIVKRAQYFVKPEKDEISLFCAELTGITPRKIEKQGRPLAEVIQSMVKNFGGSNKIYASWGRDDLILLNECREKGPFCPVPRVSEPCHLVSYSTSFERQTYRSSRGSGIARY